MLRSLAVLSLFASSLFGATTYTCKSYNISDFLIGSLEVTLDGKSKGFKERLTPETNALGDVTPFLVLATPEYIPTKIIPKPSPINIRLYDFPTEFPNKWIFSFGIEEGQAIQLRFRASNGQHYKLICEPK